MHTTFKKECYDENPHCQLHYSHGIPKDDASLFYLHYDEDLIIEYFRKGETCKRIEGNIYNIHEGDLIITTPEELHVAIRTDDCYIEKISLHINEALLTLFGGNRAVFFDTIINKQKGIGNLILAGDVQKLGIDTLLNQCLEYARENSLETQVLLNCKVIELLSTLSRLIVAGNIAEQAAPSSNKTVNEIINYINRHYKEDITLDTLAERFHFSKYYMSHLFRDYVGVSPYEYLITRRLYLFNDLIRQNHAIRQACFAVGFNNYSNFFRLYKKHFGFTPQQFRMSAYEQNN